MSNKFINIHKSGGGRYVMMVCVYVVFHCGGPGRCSRCC